ncbi:MAG TPA: uroporphyrinogen-III C-methyltransferase, partial [Gammaproteobacteria bacterium]
LTPIEPPSATMDSPVKPPSAPRPFAQPLAIAALLIALGTLVAGYFVWHEVRRQGAWQQQVLGQIDARGQSLDQRLQSFKDRLDSDLAAGERGRRGLETAQRNLASAQAGLEDALGVVRAQVSRSHADWMLAEVQYLLQVANLRAQLERDVPTAIAALTSADQRLQALSDPGFTGVREEIARERSALQAVAVPDLPGIALTLDTLAADVEQLPFKDAQVHAPRTAAPADAGTQADGQSGWTQRTRQFLANVWEALRSLVVVRRNDMPVGPLLAPEQQFFLYENLRLQLATARLAALQGETEIYRASLKTAGAWLESHFDMQAAPVAAARSELARLAGLDIRPSLPDLSASLRLLRQQMQQSEPVPDVPNARTVPDAPDTMGDAPGAGAAP